MKSVTFREHYVYLYHSMLYSRSPLLKEIYCESHRLEPWAIHGDSRRVGHYRFPNVLYIEQSVRDELLAALRHKLGEDIGYPQGVRERFTQASQALIRAQLALRQGRPTPEAIERLIEVTCRVLSSGVFKEVLEPEAAVALLAELIPTAKMEEKILALYQPLCLPHFLKFELKLLFFAERWGQGGDRRWIRACIEQAAHLARFSLEPTEFAHPARMRAALEEKLDSFGGPAGVRRQRARLLKKHQRAVRESFTAERDILQHMDGFARYSLRSRMGVMELLRFIQFLATYEELKHVQTVQAAQTLRRLMERRQLPLETTDRRALLEAWAPTARLAR